MEAHTHALIRTGQIDSKFGFTLENGDARRAVKAAGRCRRGCPARPALPHRFADLRRGAVRPCGGSDAGFPAQIREETGVTLTELNLGGGFGIPYTENDHPKACGEYMRLVAGAVKARAAKWGLPVPFMVIEPGRSVVAQAGITLYTVGGIKKIPDVRTYVSVDGGMPDNPRYALYKSEYTCVIANKADRPADTTVTVAGRAAKAAIFCRKTPRCRPASRAISSRCSRQGPITMPCPPTTTACRRPAVVMVKGDTSRVVVKAETYEDLVRNDL